MKTPPKYPINKDTSRPYRLYNAKANVFIRWRYYSSQRHAEWGVLKEMKWLPLGTVIEVVDVSKGKLLCVYEHIQQGIKYTNY